MRLLISCLLMLLPTFAARAEEAVWLLSIDRWGNSEYRALTLSRDGTHLSGSFRGRTVSGQLEGETLLFTAGDPAEDGHRFEGRIRDGVLDGRVEYPDTNDPHRRVWHAVRGRLLEPPPASAGVRRFEPRTFSNAFTADAPPALIIRPGEIIATSTVDSGGVDRDGTTRALYGNPQTGPFHVWGAQPGDVLAIKLRTIRLNRDFADSLDGFTPRATSQGMAARMGALGKRVRWRLDRDAGTATLEDAPAALEDYVIPVRPMLGGIGVAPDFGFAPFSTGDTGHFGGNMDYNGMVEGVTVYLPVFQPGALLYLGDGHAVQGDGETTQWALETSLDVEFSVEILPPRPLATPRIESDDAIATLGQAGSLDEAVRLATAGMVQWLHQDYGLDDREASLVIGTAAELRIATLAGRNAGVAMRLGKDMLRMLKAGHRDSA
ncbi:acetamidase/formamidase family protein [Coralloluteibacterium thermophilus]|uniref:Acetamidase/formamidase family protein n=1 Tax=Coralloluteibacterium thermophilum TaxID=2707049 RepID=A0ABV9NNK2_9GAMM